MKLTLAEIKPFADSISIISDLVNEATFKIKKDGLEMVKKVAFDCIFLDLHMPVMNGLQALQEIKQVRPEQSVILFSSSSDPQFNLEAAANKLGACRCFYKPFYIDEVIQAVESQFTPEGMPANGN